MKKEITPEEKHTIEFHSLESYSDKLKFWEVNNQNHFTLNNLLIKFKEKEYSKEFYDKNKISIFPNNDEEKKEYLKWAVGIETKKLNEDFQLRFQKFNLPNQKKIFIEKEKERFILKVYPKPKFESEGANKILWGVKVSYELTELGKEVELPLLAGNWNNCIKGIAYYNYITFLTDELENFSEKKNVKPNPKNKKLLWNADKNVLGEILFKLKKELKNPENGKPFLIGTDEIISEMLCEYFSNIDSKETFISYLNPSKTYNNTKKFIVKVSIEEVKK